MIKVIRLDPTDPLDGPPARAVRCTVLTELTPHPEHEVVEFAWFDTAPAITANGILVAEEVALRGASWLEQRWRDGGDRFKHIALARRAPGLTRAEFSKRWRDHAGRSGGQAIPEEARGLAYVQNHLASEWTYDAVNEVWFDDVESLGVRIDWFADNPPTPDDLFGDHTFLAVRETVL